MEQLAGVVASFDHAMILHQDTSYFGWVRTELVDLTARDGRLSRVEVALGGYDADPRSLYEIPEARRWIRQVQKAWPDAMFWLTPGSLWLWLLCLNPQMFERRPDGLVQVTLDPAIITGQFAQALAAGEQVLEARGVGALALQRIVDAARGTLQDMFERRKPGVDYTLLHPDTGDVVIYRRQQ